MGLVWEKRFFQQNMEDVFEISEDVLKKSEDVFDLEDGGHKILEDFNLMVEKP